MAVIFTSPCNGSTLCTYGGRMLASGLTSGNSSCSHSSKPENPRGTVSGTIKTIHPEPGRVAGISRPTKDRIPG